MSLQKPEQMDGHERENMKGKAVKEKITSTRERMVQAGRYPPCFNSTNTWRAISFSVSKTPVP